MSKLTATQAQYIMRRLKVFTMDTIDQIDTQLRETFVPQKLSTKELKKFLIEMAYDSPKILVSLILQGGEWAPETQRRKERDEGFTQYHKAMDIVRQTGDTVLLKIEGDLLFKDDWDKEEYPQYLEDDIMAELIEIVSGN